jgi:hypothetical protein
MHYLFIGGSHDGNRIATHGSAIIHLPIPEKTPLFRDARDFVESKTYEIETYYRAGILVGRGLIEYYVVKGMHEMDAIKQLFDRYTKSEEA